MEAVELTQDIDIDDAEFVALTKHIRGKLWTGDKELLKGLKRKKWNNHTTTDELFSIIVKRS